jgi:hypothetical protein
MYYEEGYKIQCFDDEKQEWVADVGYRARRSYIRVAWAARRASKLATKSGGGISRH